MIAAFAGLSWFAVLAEETARYVAIVGLVTLVTRVWRPAAVARCWVQQRLPGRADLRREMAASLATLLIFSLVIYLTAWGAEIGLFRIYRSIGERGWIYFVLGIVLMLLAHDFYFYVTHRMLHARGMQRFHRTHHRSHAPTPWAAYSFHPVEGLIQAAFLPLYLLLVPTHPIAAALFMTYMVASNAVGHCGHEIVPLNTPLRVLAKGFAIVTHHDLHHSAPQGNFGLYTTVWDRLFGTLHPRYEAELRRVAARMLSRP